MSNHKKKKNEKKRIRSVTLSDIDIKKIKIAGKDKCLSSAIRKIVIDLDISQSRKVIGLDR